MKKVMLGDNWDLDKLNRQNEAKFLTNYLINKYELCKNNNHDENFVLNINADWGFGKTYFLKNWADYISGLNHPVVYFDAWENDYSNEPLVAFISSINDQLKVCFDNKVNKTESKKLTFKRNKWYEQGKKVLTPYSAIVLNLIAKKVLGFSVDQLQDIFNDSGKDNGLEENEVANLSDEKEAISSLISKATQDSFERHNSRKVAIKEFKSKLEDMVSYIEKIDTIKVPIFIFIDELDRCRPNYSIELLENIKHIFRVRCVFFIVSTASAQLCESIKKVYGHNFDSFGYLKRFFDQTYKLQISSREAYSKYLFALFSLDKRNNLFSPISGDYYKDKNINCEIFFIICEAFEVGLRDMYQYCTIIDCISTTSEVYSVHIGLLTLLMIFRDKYKDKYELFSQHSRPTRVYVENIQTKDIKIMTSQFKNSFDILFTSIDINSFILIYINCALMQLNDAKRKINESNSITSLEVGILNSIIHEKNENLKDYVKLIEQAGNIS